MTESWVFGVFLMPEEYKQYLFSALFLAWKMFMIDFFVEHAFKKQHLKKQKIVNISNEFH